MKIDFNNYEYNNITEDIIKNKEFQKLDNYPHHKTTRLEHSKRVSFYSYKICKKLKLDYLSATRGGLLHDFFFDTYTKKNSAKLINNHPKISSKNAQKHFKLNNKEINIIESHMFPLNIKNRPKYIESLIVSTIDKVAGVYEKTVGYRSELGFRIGKMAIYMFLFLFN